MTDIDLDRLEAIARDENFSRATQIVSSKNRANHPLKGYCGAFGKVEGIP